MRVLIALDITPECNRIVKAVAARPWPTGTKFLLLHVLDPFPFGKAPLSLERAEEAAEAQLQNLCGELCSRGWDVKREVVLGHPRQTISKIAAAWNSDLIVVGSNEMTGVTRLLLGSTARSVLRAGVALVTAHRRGPP